MKEIYGNWIMGIDDGIYIWMIEHFYTYTHIYTHAYSPAVDAGPVELHRVLRVGGLDGRGVVSAVVVCVCICVDEGVCVRADRVGVSY